MRRFTFTPAILDALKIMLEEEDYEVETTVDGATVQDIKEPLPDLLLLDIWMSGIDGRNVCKLLKSNVATKHIPVIALTAGKLDFGPWEQVFYGEFDGDRPKRVLIKIIGE